MADNETIADIIAEIRALSNTISDGIIAINGKNIANRIEAAHKREMSKNVSKKGADFGQLGDCAKLREAAVIVYDVLEKLRPFSLCLKDVGRMREFSHLVCLAKNRLDAALAAPPRNCDRPECATSKAAQNVWRNEDGGKTAYYQWLLAIYKEGSNDGNK